METLNSHALGNCTSWSSLASCYIGDSEEEKFGAGRFEDSYAKNLEDFPAIKLEFYQKSTKTYSKEVREISKEEALACLYVQLAFIKAIHLRREVSRKIIELREQLPARKRIHYQTSYRFFRAPYQEVTKFHELSTSQKLIWRVLGILTPSELDTLPQRFDWVAYRSTAGNPDLNYLNN